MCAAGSRRRSAGERGVQVEKEVGVGYEYGVGGEDAEGLGWRGHGGVIEG